LKSKTHNISEKISKIFLVSLLIGLVYIIIKGSDYKKEIEEHTGQTICKYTFREKYGKSKSAYVKYYVDNKLYRNRVGNSPDDYNATINKYYELKYSTINPNKILVDFSKEVKDSALIKELKMKLEFKYWLVH
jgi:hypothetical protein